MYTLFIFRRDFRINDNLALNSAIKFAEENNHKLILAFSFNDTQIRNNEYFSASSFEFMLECLDDLNKQLSYKLSFFEGPKFYKYIKDVKTIAFNVDYTPYAKKRDNQIIKYCKANNIHVITDQDYTLFPMKFIKTQSDESTYKVFTPFYNMCLSKVKNILPSKSNFMNFNNIETKRGINIDNRIGLKHIIFKKYKLSKSSKDIYGGREEVMKIFRLIKNTNTFDYYTKHRNFPHIQNSTTRLSAYIKYGCVSIREVFHLLVNKYGIHHDLVKQLFWREFYANITHSFPYTLSKMISKKDNSAFYKYYNKIDWNTKSLHFEKWCKGETGFPIVDAGMKQLNETGFMHNRLRMITASFLIKDLGIDWREGEKYFASKLIDYDPSANNGGWQWVAGTGTDASPYFRVFNPWTQIKNFDSQCKYVKFWIPALSNVKVEDIHKWYDKSVRSKYTNIRYNPPIVDHDKQKNLIVKKYKKLKENK